MVIRRGTGRGTSRGNPGRGSRGACGGTRRRDSSGGGSGNKNTPNQPKSRR